MLNEYAPVVLCCPLTTNIKNYHGNVILASGKKTGLKQESEILTFHLRSLSKARLKEKIGKISTSELEQVHGCLQDILRY